MPTARYVNRDKYIRLKYMQNKMILKIEEPGGLIDLM